PPQSCRRAYAFCDRGNRLNNSAEPGRDDPAAAVIARAGTRVCAPVTNPAHFRKCGSHPYNSAEPGEDDPAAAVAARAGFLRGPRPGGIRRVSVNRAAVLTVS